jgi:hypothetical protein
MSITSTIASAITSTIASAGATIVRFPSRVSAAIRVLNDEGGWLVLSASTGDSADADARWMSRNTGLPIRAKEDDQ